MLTAGPASAACHAFVVSVDPRVASEGERVTVTVSRDGAVAPSQIDVSTTGGRATPGDDYRELNETVAFTDETQQTFNIPITDDDSDERAEGFRVHLSNPGGCDPNPNFEVSRDVLVAIRDNDAAPEPEETEAEEPDPEETEAEEPSPDPEETEAEEPTPEETEAEEPSPEPVASEDTVAPAAAEEDDSGVSTGVIVAILAAIVIGGTAVVLARRRSRPATAPGEDAETGAGPDTGPDTDTDSGPGPGG